MFFHKQNGNLFSLLFFHPPIRTRMLCFFSIQIHKGVKVCFRNIFSFSLRCLKQRKTNWNPSRNWLILIAMVREKLWADVCWTEGAGIKGWTRSRSKKIFYELQSALIWWANRARATRFYTHDVEHFYSSDLTLFQPPSSTDLTRFAYDDDDELTNQEENSISESESRPFECETILLSAKPFFKLKHFATLAREAQAICKEMRFSRDESVSRVTMIWSESSDDPPLHSLSSFGER